jgi:hypothetical protein
MQTQKIEATHQDLRRRRERAKTMIMKGTPEVIYQNSNPTKNNFVKISFKKDYNHSKTKCRVCGYSFNGSDNAIFLQIFKERNFFHTKGPSGQNCWRKFVRICLEMNWM